MREMQGTVEFEGDRVRGEVEREFEREVRLRGMERVGRDEREWRWH